MLIYKQNPYSCFCKNAPHIFAASGLSLVAVSYGLSRYSFGLFLPVISAEFALTGEVIGLIAGGSYLGSLIAMVLGAWLSAGLGPRASIILGGVAAVAGMGLIALAGTPALLAVGVIVAGASPGFAYPPLSEVIVRCIRLSSRNTVYAWMNSGTGFGVALAGPFALFAAQHWRVIWLIFAFCALLATMWNIAVVPPLSPGNRNRYFSIKIGQIVRRKESSYIILSSIIFGVVSSIYWVYAVYILDVMTGDSRSIVIFWTIMGVSGILGCFAGKIINSWGLRRSYQAVMTMMALAIFILPFAAHATLGIYLSALFFGAGFIIATASFGVWSMVIFRDAPSLGFGAVFFLISLGQGVGPILVGFMTPWLNIVIFFGLAAVICVGLAGFLAPGEKGNMYNNNL